MLRVSLVRWLVDVEYCGIAGGVLENGGGGADNMAGTTLF